MKLEAGKEMDRCCVLGWLSEVYRHPTVAFNTYSDEQQIEFAHDALVLLKKQEAVEPRWFVDAHNPAGAFQCSACRERIIEKNIDFYCPNCGKPILWEGR